MKPPHWESFLQYLTQTYDLHGKLKEIFLARFDYENWRKPDTEIWEIAQAASHETYKKQMTQIYGLFAQDKPQGCPELDATSKGPGKFQILREWFKDILYPQWQEQQKPSLLGLGGEREEEKIVYVSRPPLETEALQELLRPGALIRIRAPEKMGKTSLLKWLLNQLKSHHYRTVYVNFAGVESSFFKNLDKFLRWFCASVSRELALAPQLDDYWDEELFGSLMSCKTYFQSYILGENPTPLVLGLDNLDRLFEFGEIAQDFLPMLRYWHEEAHNTVPWPYLRLAIANSTEAYFKLDANQSPFNVGRSVKLNGFTPQQVQELSQNYTGLPAELTDVLTELQRLVGGHPYLLHLAFSALQSSDTNLQQLIGEAPTQSGVYSDHLRRHWVNLHSVPDLWEALKSVVMAKQPVQLEPGLAYQLESLGLIILQGDLAQMSCPLYYYYFRDNL